MKRFDQCQTVVTYKIRAGSSPVSHSPVACKRIRFVVAEIQREQNSSCHKNQKGTP